MIFKQLCIDYIHLHKTLFFSYIIIASISYIVKVLVTPMIYSNILDLKNSDNFLSIIKQICFLWVIIGIIYIVKVRIENKLFPEFLSFVRQHLFKLFLEKNKINFNESNVSSDITRILEVTRCMKDIFSMTCQLFIPLSILTLCINGYFLYKVPLLGAVNMICNATIVTYTISSYPSLVKSSNKREIQYMNMIKKLDENFNNLLNIYLNDQVAQTIESNKKIEDEYSKIYKSQNQEVLSFINKFKLINYIFAIVCIFLLYKHSNSKDFINILLIFTFYISTLENISEDIPSFIMLMGNINNAQPFLEGVLYSDKDKKHISKFKGDINFDNISFKYGDKYIFKNFSLDIKSRERIGIMAQTGKGKSTLMKLLLNFYELEDGKIYLDGMDLKEINVDDVRKRINYVNQKTFLFNDTIMNNMKYGNSASDDTIIDLLKKYDLLKVFKNDLNFMVDKNGMNISLGTQKVIFLVRGFLKDCDIIILDEPFSSIDQETRTNVLKMIDEETKEKTLIVITHDLNGLETVLDKMIEL